ncbi:TetR family transcriptional regulator [Mesorhizobium sp. J18]|uniref:TetR/AcrR family transcriptional regulator n=1 Tax=Mesorhizobium sp. J18 TaxID=935263 RepID=UPI00119A316E|nr:TetR/AcrR family transcriptional regulator [Mesorhizobium sp. J18]TWG94836.1 TetR family transcriptional regulator [Mesorhizobium sp. J18]
MTLDVREHNLDSSRLDILRAAATCFMERGYAAASIDEVARSLGATKGRIYHHYPSKADLFADVFRTGMDMNYEAIAPYRDLAGPALPRWRRMAFAHVMQMITTRAFQRAVWIGVEMHLRGATTPEQRTVFNELIAYRSAYGDVFRETLRQGRAEGVFFYEDLSITNQLMFMTLNSPIFWYSPRSGETLADIEHLATQVVDFAEGGLVTRKEQAA